MNRSPDSISNGVFTRRSVFRQTAGSLVWAGCLNSQSVSANGSKPKLRIGLIADVHKDIIHDADARLLAFVDAMTAAHADAVIQLGDFCIPKPENEPFLDIFRKFSGPRYHVLGNHDMDGGYTREQAVKFLGMPAQYYSFDLGGLHFVILDANDRPPGHKSGYPKSIGPEQLDWLERDLAASKADTFVFSHQSLERPSCITNQADVRAIFENARFSDGRRKVAACSNGHWHIDHAREIGGIPYVHINSASYVWVEDVSKRRPRLSGELGRKFPTVASTIPYVDPLFAVLEIDRAAGRFEFHGRQSAWLGPGPDQIGYSPTSYPAGSMYPGVRSRHFSFPT
ncbi:alkaline phosphatase [bacterium]|nr:alkaline phosphatase [bacterium]